MRFRLLPSDDRFFDLFDEAAQNVAACARHLRDVVTADDHRPAFEAVRACERTGDEFTRQILQRLNTSFVTPFDREDIHALTEELDDAVDDMYAVADRIELTGAGKPIPELQQQADLLVTMADATVALVSKLGPMKGVREHLDLIDQTESEGDAVYRQALARLFSGEYEALDVIRWKDIIEAMEAALNSLENVSDVVESIVLKHA